MVSKIIVGLLISMQLCWISCKRFPIVHGENTFCVSAYKGQSYFRCFEPDIFEKNIGQLSQRGYLLVSELTKLLGKYEKVQLEIECYYVNNLRSSISLGSRKSIEIVDALNKNGVYHQRLLAKGNDTIEERSTEEAILKLKGATFTFMILE